MKQYFSDTCNVLSNISKVKEYPFPFAGSFECLPLDIYAELAATRPSWQAIAQKKSEENNKRADLPGELLLESKTLAPIWLNFIRYHTSRDFYLQILDRFEFHFLQFYPQLKNMRDYKVSRRYSGEAADIYLDCQLSVNTPVKEKSTVNHPHLDHPRELWASLLYMKESDDDAGGDLMLYKTIKPLTFHGRREVDSECIWSALQIPYSPNTYICFINSPFSVHGVTEREVTEKPRLMVNISLEFMKRGEELFNVQ